MPDDRVRLTIEAVADAARPARVAGSGLAFRLGLSYQQVEDFRVAIDQVVELASTYLEGPVQVTYAVIDDALSLTLADSSEGDASPKAPGAQELETFSKAVTDLVSSHRVDAEGGIHLEVARPERD